MLCQVLHKVVVVVILAFTIRTAALPSPMKVSPMKRPPPSKLPRTWNKPYYGTPSLKCRRNPGADPLELQTFAKHNLDFTLAHSQAATFSGASNDKMTALDEQSERLLDDHTTTTTIVPRQPPPQPQPRTINNNMLAAFHFMCPQGGAMSQIFLWGVVYVAGERNVRMVPWHNIIGFAGTSLFWRTRHWQSTWASTWCVPHDKLECIYVATASTTGVMDPQRERISIELVTPPPGDPYFPKIMEYCGEIGTPPAMNNGASCIVEGVEYFVQGPR